MTDTQYTTTRNSVLQIASVTLILLGIALTICSPVWPRIASSSFFWNKAAVEQYTQSVMDMHHANTEAAFSRSAQEGARQAQSRFHENQVKLSRARQFRERGGPMMRRIGGFLSLVGIVLYLVGKRSAD